MELSAMKKYAIVLVVLAGLVLGGCGSPKITSFDKDGEHCIVYDDPRTYGESMSCSPITTIP
jgi:uncharacterized protein YceK